MATTSLSRLMVIRRVGSRTLPTSKICLAFAQPFSLETSLGISSGVLACTFFIKKLLSSCYSTGTDDSNHRFILPDKDGRPCNKQCATKGQTHSEPPILAG